MVPEWKTSYKDRMDILRGLTLKESLQMGMLRGLAFLEMDMIGGLALKEFL